MTTIGGATDRLRCREIRSLKPNGSESGFAGKSGNDCDSECGDRRQCDAGNDARHEDLPGGQHLVQRRVRVRYRLRKRSAGNTGDAAGTAWAGSYETWSDFLPGAAEDVFPGDAIAVNVPSRGASFTAIVREIEIQIADPADDRGFYTIGFANDLAAPLAIEYTASSTTISLQEMPPLPGNESGGRVLPSESDRSADHGEIHLTTVQVDAGISPANGEGH